MSWDDAQAYVAWLSTLTGKTYRLPSEAEWEYCCRANTDTPFWWGAAITPDQANYDGNYDYDGGPKGPYRERTLPVDAFEANPWGLCQVHGNVWEWVEDGWHASYLDKPDDLKATGGVWTTEGGGPHVLRGGSCSSYPYRLRAAVRSRGSADYRDYYGGFRLARTLF